MIKILSGANFKAKSKISSPTHADIVATVSKIIADVIDRGDEALRDYTKEFDGCELESFEVSRNLIDEAALSIDPEFYEIMERAAKNIEEFHRLQIREGFEIRPDDGVILGQRVIPLNRVGLYVPGGTAAYPSSVLMNVIPAKLAGVKEIIIVTPPQKDGTVNPAILAAAKIAGADTVLTIGGAQAVAALAYGTKSVPRVDKITGPGNAYVAEAKRQVFGVCGIDMIAGPSDILVIADSTADPVLVAADMLSQCEHGSDSPAVLVTTDEALGRAVSEQLEIQLNELSRGEMARAAVLDHGMIIIAKDLDEAFEIANDMAPEHLEICLDNPMDYLDKVINAGSVFLGKSTPEALCDYYAGPNHTLPTEGTARFSSPLSVDDFVKKSSYAYYSEDALKKAAADVITFANKEGLTAHAQSVAKRVNLK